MPLTIDTIDLLVTADHRARRNTDPQAQTERADHLGQAIADATHTPIRYAWRPVLELLTPTWTHHTITQIERSRQHLENTAAPNPTVRHFTIALAAAIHDRLGGPLTEADHAATTPNWTRPRLSLSLSPEDRTP